MWSIGSIDLLTLLLRLCLIPQFVSSECKFTAPESPCADGWAPTVNPQTCIQVREKNLTWYEARGDCQKDGADLAIIYNEIFKESLLVAMESQVLHPHWIGLVWNPNASEWLWNNVHKVDKDYQIPWGRFEPDQRNDTHNRWCAAILPEELKWSDEDCDAWFQFFCEVDPHMEALCDSHWSSYNDTCVQLRSNKLPWSEAQVDCQNDGANLAVVNEGLMKFIRGGISAWPQGPGPGEHNIDAELTSIAVAVDAQWVGLVWNASSLYWNNLREANENVVSALPWDQFVPDGGFPTSETLCAAIMSNQLTWRNCTESLAFYCEANRMIKSTCPSSQYKTIFVEKCIVHIHVAMPFDEAVKHCEDLGMEFVSYRLRDVTPALEEFWGHPTYYIGLHMHLKRHTPIWLDHKGFIAGHRIINSIPGFEDCFHLDLKGNDYPSHCTIKANYVCQKLSRHGPSPWPEVDIDFETEEGTAFVNRSVKVKCSTSGPRQQRLMLATSDGALDWDNVNRGDFVVGTNVLVSALQEEEVGVNETCRLWTTFIFDFLVTERMNNTRFICFSYNEPNKETCDDGSGEMFCASSRPITVYHNGPSRPTIKVVDLGSDLVAEAGSAITAKCEGMVSKDKKYTWVMIQDDKVQILGGADPRIVTNEVVFGDDPHHQLNESAYKIYMSLTISVFKHMDGFRLACYTIDSAKYSYDGSQCVWPYNLCARTAHIKVRGNFLQAHGPSLIIVVVVILLIVFFVAMRTLRGQPVQLVIGEPEGDEPSSFALGKDDPGLPAEERRGKATSSIGSKATSLATAEGKKSQAGHKQSTVAGSTVDRVSHKSQV